MEVDNTKQGVGARRKRGTAALREGSGETQEDRRGGGYGPRHSEEVAEGVSLYDLSDSYVQIEQLLDGSQVEDSRTSISSCLEHFSANESGEPNCESAREGLHAVLELFEHIVQYNCSLNVSRHVHISR